MAGLVGPMDGPRQAEEFEQRGAGARGEGCFGLHCSFWLPDARFLRPRTPKLSNLIHGREGINFSGLNKPALMVVQPLPTHMSRATILHVEDDSNDALLFQHACRKAGMDVNLRVVADGEQAQAYLKGSAQFQNRDDHPFPTLVVLDLKLSFVNGFEVLEWMRKETK